LFECCRARPRPLIGITLFDAGDRTVPTFGVRSQFAFVIGPRDPARPISGVRDVDVYAAGHWLTCDDSHAYLPHFTQCLMREVSALLDDDSRGRFTRPYPELSPADNHRRLRAEARDGDNRAHLYHRFMDWGPTSDNVSAHLFVGDGIASIPFSFWRPEHHDRSELGQVFIAELPERELLRVLHRAAWELAIGGIE
jgi:hypothetical protein